MSSAFEGLPKTPNLKLNKPGYDNVADIEALNENADILDAEIQGIKNTFVKSVNGKEPDAGGNVNVEEYTHPNSGVTAGTYRSVTVNAQGHVTAGSNPTLAIADGGTGVTSIADIIKALFGTSALGSSSKPIYYTGSAFAACAASVGAANNGGIIAASLNTNGYVKFANGLILQWVNHTATSRTWVTITFPIAFPSDVYTLCSGYSTNGTGSYYGYTKSITKTNFQAYVDKGETFRYIAIGK